MFNKMSGRKFLNAYLQQMSIPYVTMFQFVGRRNIRQCLQEGSILRHAYTNQAELSISDRGEKDNKET